MNMLALRNRTVLSQFDRTFESFVKEFINDEDVFNFPILGQNYGVGSTNIKELDDKFVLEIQVPGYNKNDIDINLEDDILEIKGKVENKIEEEGKVHRKDFNKSSFYRTFTLPENINKEEIQASIENGILSISILKKEEEKIETIKIEIK